MDDALHQGIRRLRDAGLAGPGRASAMDRADATQQAIEEEIRGEIAAALGRSGRKLRELLAELAGAGRAVDAATGGQRRRRIAHFNRLRARAERAKWELVVHREAIGLVRHDDLDDLYPIPPKR